MGGEVLLPLKPMSPSKSAEVLGFKVSHLEIQRNLGGGKMCAIILNYLFELKKC